MSKQSKTVRRNTKRAAGRAKVYTTGDGKFTVHYHSNYWIEIDSAA